MRHSVECLSYRADRVVAGTIEQAYADAYEDPLHRIVADLPTTIEESGSLCVDLLREKGADEASIARILRAIQAETIEVLRDELGEGPAFEEAVVALRDCIRKSLPHIPIDARCSQLLEHIERGRLIPPAPEQRQLFDLFQGFLETLRDMVYAHDVNGTLFFINDAGLKLLKYAREDMFDSVSIYDFVVPDFIDLVDARLESPGAVLRSPYSIEIYTKDGHRVPIEIDTRPLLGPGGEVTAVVGVARDLTLERRLQDEISRTYADMQNLFEALSVGVMLVKHDGTVENANTAAVTLCGAGDINDLVGINVQSICGGNDDETTRAIMAAIKDKKAIKQPCMGTTRFGARLNCEVLVQPLNRAHKDIDGFLLLLLDLSRQAELQRALVQTEKAAALGELVAGAAHELNNPLTGILGYSQLLLKGQLEPTLRKQLDMIAEEAQRCKHIVENLLGFADSTELRTKPLDINELLNDTLALREYQLRVDHIQVTTDFAQGLPVIEGDASELRKVFLNIVNNAQRALTKVSDRKRELRVKTILKKGAVSIRFEDNGPGIPPDKASRVFDPFYTTGGIGETIGLGLTVSYGIVQSHKGNICVESEEGRGTTLVVTLPIPQTS